MKTLILFALLLSQVPDMEYESYAEFKEAMQPSRYNLVTLIAVEEDGTPMSKGYIGCAGLWFKYSDEADEEQLGERFMFRADSRGAIILNPFLTDKRLTCYAEKGSKTGSVQFEMHSPSKVQEIVIR